MSSTSRRLLSRFAIAGVTSSLLVGTVATSAQAATAPHLVRSQAKAALPTSASLPGHVKRVGAVALSDITYATPCTTVPKKVTLPGGAAAIAGYKNTASVISPKYLEWGISIVVFPSASKATAAVARLNKAEKVCPGTKQTDEGGVVTLTTRTLSKKDKVSAWSGYSTIDHVSLTSTTDTATLRGYTTYVARGNVLVYLAAYFTSGVNTRAARS